MSSSPSPDVHFYILALPKLKKSLKKVKHFTEILQIRLNGDVLPEFLIGFIFRREPFGEPVRLGSTPPGVDVRVHLGRVALEALSNPLARFQEAGSPHVLVKSFK